MATYQGVLWGMLEETHKKENNDGFSENNGDWVHTNLLLDGPRQAGPISVTPSQGSTWSRDWTVASPSRRPPAAACRRPSVAAPRAAPRRPAARRRRAPRAAATPRSVAAP